MKENILEYDQITDFLYVGKTPSAKDYEELSNIGISLVINMRAEKYALPTKSRKLINTTWVPSLDSSLTPISMKLLNKAIAKSKIIIENGGKVYVYCRAGRHRSIAMAVAILISQGHDVDSAVRLIKSKRIVADPETQHIFKVITKFAQLHGQRKSSKYVD